MKHNALMRCIENLDVNVLVDMQSVYENVFSALYVTEFKEFFKAISGNIYGKEKDTRMSAMKPFKFEDFIEKNDEEKSEMSRSNLSTVSGVGVPNYGAKMLKHMPTLLSNNRTS